MEACSGDAMGAGSVDSALMSTGAGFSLTTSSDDSRMIGVLTGVGDEGVL